ncbi:MAG: transposase-like protein [Candidatus Pseudothioglobus sp.]|jgi:transposase-like protein
MDSQQKPDNQDGKFSEPQLRAARMIAMGIPFNDIAAELDVDRTTIFRWRKQPQFSAEVKKLTETVAEESHNKVIRDISEIKDVILGTLLDVAQNDASGSARVSAARTLSELVEKAEERSTRVDYDVMRDQTGEIKTILQEIRSMN